MTKYKTRLSGEAFIEAAETYGSSDFEPLASTTIRAQVLENASRLTNAERNATYGDPFDNLTVAANLRSAFWNGTTLKQNTPHGAAIDAVLTKLARIATGSELFEDNYVDGAAYFAIAYEVGKRSV